MGLRQVNEIRKALSVEQLPTQRLAVCVEGPGSWTGTLVFKLSYMGDNLLIDLDTFWWHQEVTILGWSVPGVFELLEQGSAITLVGDESES